MTSYSLLREKCGFSRHDFGQFKGYIDKQLLKPCNSVGLGGLICTVFWRKELQEWLDKFMDSGVGDKYWGPGTDRMWSFATERAKVRAFLREAVAYFARLLRLRKVGKEAVKANQDREAAAAAKVKVDPEADPEALKRESSLLAFSKHHMADSISHLSNVVLLTCYPGSRQFKVIRGTDAPTLAHLIQSIQKVYWLRPDHEISRISVKIGERVCNVHLDESRDWKYISRLIAKNGGTAEMALEFA